VDRGEILDFGDGVCIKCESIEDETSEIGAETVDKDVDGMAEGIFILF